MKFKKQLTEGTHYDKDAIKMLVNSGLYDEENAAKIINGLKDNDIHAFNYAPNWLLKYLKGIARMLLQDINGDKEKAPAWLTECISVFETYLSALCKCSSFKSTARI